jgi:hypothetical protein
VSAPGDASWPLIVLGGGTAAILLLALPRLLLKRAQDRLARRLLSEDSARYKLLTRAELAAGAHRRLPGVLGLTDHAVEFHGLFGETVALPTAGIQKIVTGQRLGSGRQLLRLETLRLTRPDGEDVELVLPRASASAWRSHLGLWAVNERKAAMDVVAPGRK